jgi:ribosome-binding factor A
VETLNAASGFLRRELSSRVSLKTIPFLSFVQDDSIEKGTQLLDKIAEIRSNDSSVGAPI